MENKSITVISLLAILVIGSAWFLFRSGQKPSLLGEETNQILSSKYAVSESLGNAFGELADLSGQNKSAELGGENFGAGVNEAKMSAPSDDSAVSFAPPGVDKVYTFKYTGAPLENLPKEQSVFRREKVALAGNIVSRIIKTLSLGLIDLSAFQNQVLQNFSIAENIEKGYITDVDVANGAVSIYQNWDRWPRPIDTCASDDCYEESKVSIEEILPDEDIISIANKFVLSKNISVEGYLPPVVNNNWREQYEKTEDKLSTYIPMQLEVVYQMVVDGLPVTDESGEISGLHIAVDVREKKVASVYDLTTRQFQKSNYLAENSSERIISIAEKGGFRNYNYPTLNETSTEVITLELGTPTKQMLKMWKYSDTVSEEIYVPSLVFPIKNKGDYWRKNVVVPLMKEILDNDNSQPPAISYPAEVEPI